MQPRKSALFVHEFVGEEAWADIVSAYGDDAGSLLRRTTFIMFKPDSVVKRRIVAALDFLSANGFFPVAARALTIRRNAAHHVWRYQWNAASVDRMVLATRANEEGEALFVMLRDGAPEDIPASVRLWLLKGSVFAEHRTPGQLRSRLDVRNRMLGYVHTPDEPADIVRELGILFPQAERQALLSDAAAGHPFDILPLIDRLEAAAPEHSLDLDEVIARRDGAFGGRLAGFRARAEAGDKLSLAELANVFGPLESHCDRWDFITAGSLLIRHEKPGVEPVLDALAVRDVAALWRQPAR